MLVLDIVAEESGCDKGLLKRRKRNTFQPERNNLYMKDKVFNIVHMTKQNIEDSSVKRILEVNRGRVLKCKCDEINSIISEYIMDIRPYIKRAILSSLIKEAKYNINIDSLCIYDNDFVELGEYFELAKKIRKISIISRKTNEIEAFIQKCYCKLGVKIDSSEGYINLYRAKLDLNEIIMNKSAFLNVDGYNMLVYADEAYFSVDEYASQLLKYETPIEYICASLNM